MKKNIFGFIATVTIAATIAHASAQPVYAGDNESVAIESKFSGIDVKFDAKNKQDLDAQLVADNLLKLFNEADDFGHNYHVESLLKVMNFDFSSKFFGQYDKGFPDKHVVVHLAENGVLSKNKDNTYTLEVDMKSTSFNTSGVKEYDMFNMAVQRDNLKNSEKTAKKVKFIITVYRDDAEQLGGYIAYDGDVLG